MPPRNYRNAPRRSCLPRLLIGGLGLFTLITFGVIGTLWLAGIPLNPFADRAVAEDPFMIRIPINARPIAAYRRVDRMDLMNPAGGLMVQKLPPQAGVGMSIVGVASDGSHVESKIESVKNVDDEVVFVVTGGADVRQANTITLGGAMMNVNAIIGRVVKNDKRAGLGFQESTFFPQGTPEGLAGATPKGMRAITLDATRLTGIHSLGAGDTIDLLANMPVSEEDGAMTEVELLAQKATVLRPVYVRNEVTSSSSLMNGKQNQNVPKYEVALAVMPDDVIPLQNAINRNLSLTCIAHSMQPVVEGEDASVTVATASEVKVPVTVRPILAYNVVSRDAFVSPATRAIKTETISRQEADRIGAITSLADALGAIVRQDIPAGRYLRHADLLNGPPNESGIGFQPVLDAATGRKPIPRDGTQFVSMLQAEPNTPQAPAATAVGDRPAITRFVPAGMKAFAIPWNRLYGSEHVQIGDRIDLMASYPLERIVTVTEKRIDENGESYLRTYDKIETRKSSQPPTKTFDGRGEPWFVATDAIVVGPVGFPAPPPAQRALANADDPNLGRGTGDRSGVRLNGSPLIVAVAEMDAENFVAALVTNEALFSVAIQSDSEVRPGMKSIALCPTTIERYEEFDEAVWLNNRRRIMTRMVDANDPRFFAAIDAREIETYYGQTMATEKSRWDFFTLDDFLPFGIGPGIAAGATPGHTIAIVEDKYFEGLPAFDSEDRVSILLRAVTHLNDNIIYAGTYRDFPSGTVVVRDARIVRHSVGETVAIELNDCDMAVFQAGLAYVKGLNDNAEKPTQGVPSLVAVVQPRGAVALMPEVGRPFSQVESFDSFDALKFMDVIVGSRRSTYAFDSVNRDDGQ